jgi:type IV pilus assembly protein PilW
MSLVEILVGMAIGLIGMLVIFQSFSAFEGQKRTTTVGNDAQESGLMALTAIEREVRLAGYGMFYANAMACGQALMRQWDGSAASTVPLMPVSITDGTSNAPDALVVSYSTSAFAATPSQIQTDFNGTVPRIVVDNSARNTAFQAGQYILVGNPYNTTLPCTRLQVSSVQFDAGNPAFLGINVAPGPSTPANPTNLSSFLPGTYRNSRDAPSVVVNMGTFNRVQYSVVLDANRNGRLVFRDITAAAAPNVEIADGIVNLQAQYGVSTSAASQNVTAWVNASGTPWGNPSLADIGRIKAVRLAVVARSQLMERDTVASRDLRCENVSGTNNNGPCAWRDTSASPAPLIDLSGDPNWQRYRYRVYETIVPLRNVMWQTF